MRKQVDKSKMWISWNKHNELMVLNNQRWGPGDTNSLSSSTPFEWKPHKSKNFVLINKFSELGVDLGTQNLLDEQFILIIKQNILAYILYLLYLCLDFLQLSPTLLTSQKHQASLLLQLPFCL